MGTVERVSVAIAALLLTHSAALYFRIGPIERDLVEEAHSRLFQQGLGHVAVVAEGRDLTLTGWVRDRREAARALAIAAGTTGVRVIRDELQERGR